MALKGNFVKVTAILISRWGNARDIFHNSKDIQDYYSTVKWGINKFNECRYKYRCISTHKHTWHKTLCHSALMIIVYYRILEKFGVYLSRWKLKTGLLTSGVDYFVYITTSDDSLVKTL
jgi:hypothetical protein